MTTYQIKLVVFFHNSCKLSVRIFSNYPPPLHCTWESHIGDGKCCILITANCATFFNLHCTLVTVGKNRLFSYKNIISFIVTPYLYKFYYPRFHFIKKSIIGLYAITILFEMVSRSQCPSPVVDIFTPYVLYLIYLSHQELVTHGIWQTSDLHACEMCFPLFPREVSYIVSYLPPFSFSSA